MFILFPFLTWFFSLEDIATYSFFLISVGFVSVVSGLAMEQSYIRGFYSVADNLRLLLECVSVSLLGLVAVSSVIFMFSDVALTYIFSRDDFKYFVYICTSLLFLNLKRFTSLFLRFNSYPKAFFVSELCFSSTMIIGILIGSLFLDEMDLDDLILLYLSSYVFYFIVIFSSVRFDYKLVTSYKIDFLEFRSKIEYSLPLMVSLLVVSLLSLVDKFYLKQYVSLEEFGLYMSALKVVGAIALIKPFVGIFWTPVSMKWYEQGKKLNSYSVLFTGIIFFVNLFYMLVLFAVPIITPLFNKEFTELFYLVPILLLYPCFYLFSEITQVGILYTKKTRYSLYAASLSVITSLTLSHLLIPSYGVTSAAIILSFTFLVFFCLRTYYSAKIWRNFITINHASSILILIMFSVIIFYQGLNVYNVLLFIALNVIVNISDLKKLKALINIESRKAAQ